MASKIDLISNAFLLIGTPTINSLTDGTSRANTAANLYDSTYESLLTSNRWRFAHQRLELSKLVTAPAHTYSTAFQLPADYLMAVSIYPHSDNYEIYGDKLYCNLDAVTLDYIGKPAETKLPAYFQKLLEYRLAVEFCIPITENRALKETLKQDYIGTLSSAMFADAQGRPSTEPLNNPLINVRY
jgi:hypothetical protein